MERTLGINPNSPSLLFAVSTEPSTVKKAPRSSRRTTMMSSELNETLREIQNIASTNRRRSVRVAARGKYYGDGSPRKDDENKDAESPVFRHPLLENEKQLDLQKQRKHNQTILDFINIGNVKLIGGLPAVGPKTAFLIYQHRELHGCYESLQQLDLIPGMNKNFFKKFCKQNQINGLEN
eukprot:TRINITY_DN39768_c0_g1_i1.p1 TRINITY_DN39768_c0_g1~~TRINITY_DN39768_c0_g1_i1.p1  ORF type:complete len:188 (-),score=45.40 TRINITY_DN39768_c0_g1_i1:32-571(-)